MSARWDPDFFAQRELAANRAILLNRTLNRTEISVSLFDCPPVEPDPAELNAVRQAHARATALGLVLPAFPATTVQFVRAHGTPQAGETRKRDGVIEMVFPAGLPLDALRHVALHELAHVHQFARGSWLSVEEREHEAECFAWNAQEGWRP